jgi:predicted O-methyltransferase YrrM
MNGFRAGGAVKRWESNGRPAPPPDKVKQDVVLEYGQRYGTSSLVETGTYLGDMIEAVKGDFSHIYSIELDKSLHDRARERFSGQDHIELIEGDSAAHIGRILGELDSPALFWLDAHGDQTPIYEELTQILDAPDEGHIMLIDDARFFGKFPAYRTMDDLKEFVLSKRRNLDIAVEYDIIRITPQEMSR